MQEAVIELEKPRRNKWWLSYFIFMLGISALAMVFSDLSVLEISKSVFFALGLIAMWGYINQVAIGRRLLWIVYFFLVLGGVVYTIGNFLFGLGSPWPIENWFVVAIALVLTFPQWLVLWLYSFRSDGLWQTTE